MEASIVGQRRLKLLEHRETYEFGSPNLQIRFFPNAGTAWVGSTSVKCKETGLEAVVNFGFGHIEQLSIRWVANSFCCIVFSFET